MRIKKFIAESVPEALQKIKGDMGENAVILNTRNLGNSADRGSNRGFEVTAAAEYPKSFQRAQERRELKPENLVRVNSNESASPDSEPQVNPPDEFRLVNETFNPDISKICTENYLQLIPSEIGQLYRLISRQNIDPDIIETLIKDTLSGNISGNRELSLSRRWTDYLAEKCCRAKSPDKLFSLKPLAFSGFSGCGRSTIIAKIAYSLIKEKKYEVSIISLDNYNVSGQHMLRRLSKLLGVRFTNTSRLNEVEQRIANHKSGHVLLFDLPALDTSDKSEDEILEQFSLLPVSNILVVDASRHFNTLRGIIESSNRFNPKYLAVSHLNEIEYPGAVVNALIRSQLIPVLGGGGRRVSDGYIPLRPKKMCEQLFNDIISEESDDK